MQYALTRALCNARVQMSSCPCGVFVWNQNGSLAGVLASVFVCGSVNSEAHA